jgi:hypothetical protein
VFVLVMLVSLWVVVVLVTDVVYVVEEDVAEVEVLDTEVVEVVLVTDVV